MYPWKMAMQSTYQCALWREKACFRFMLLAPLHVLLFQGILWSSKHSSHSFLHFNPFFQDRNAFSVNSKNQFYFFSVLLYTWLLVCMHTAVCSARRGRQRALDLLGLKLTTVDCEPPLCVLGAEPGCSVRVTGALKHSTISPVLRQLIFNNEWYLQLALEKLTQRLSWKFKEKYWQFINHF